MSVLLQVCADAYILMECWIRVLLGFTSGEEEITLKAAGPPPLTGKQPVWAMSSENSAVSLTRSRYKTDGF